MDKTQVTERKIKRKVIGLFFFGLLLMAVVEVWIGWICGDWGRLKIGWLNYLLGPALSAGGIALVIWSVLTQYRVGDGTPAPMVATKKLVIQGPYFYTRNPMTLGALFVYTGIGIWMSSFVLIVLSMTVFSSLLLLIYIHETRELTKRFGEEYQVYRKRTPFLVPKISQKHN